MVLFDKKWFEYLIGYKDAKKLDLYVYFSPKWLHIDETLMKLNTCLFWIKHDKVLEKFDAVWEKVRKIIKE